MFRITNLTVSEQPFASERYKTLPLLHNDYLASLGRIFFSLDFVFSDTLYILATQYVNI